MKVFKEGKVPVKMWGEGFEASCLEQVTNASKLPFAFHHVALMPDGHSGYGVSIGTVLATDNYIIPNAIGVDIGCGVAAIKTDIKEISEEEIKRAIGLMRETIPVGFRHHNEPQLDLSEFILKASFNEKLPEVFNREKDKVTYTLGTLGGGNHFCEVSRDVDGFVWLMCHSGSRNLGKQICDHYNDIAKNLSAKYFSSVPAEWDLAFLHRDTVEARDYLNEMLLALEFAYLNRGSILKKMMKALGEARGPFGISIPINCHHNYATLENHFGKNVYVHRKGAIRARVGDYGIIPGSMGTSSFVVKGLGNPESFQSASHGAGRKMSRTEANKTISVEEANKSIEGVVFGRWGKDRGGKADVSESPLAYKSIYDVMDAQKDLVEIVTELKPIGVMKG